SESDWKRRVNQAADPDVRRSQQLTKLVGPRDPGGRTASVPVVEDHGGGLQVRSRPLEKGPQQSEGLFGIVEACVQLFDEKSLGKLVVRAAQKLHEEGDQGLVIRVEE